MEPLLDTRAEAFKICGLNVGPVVGLSMPLLQVERTIQL